MVVELRVLEYIPPPIELGECSCPMSDGTMAISTENNATTSVAILEPGAKRAVVDCISDHGFAQANAHPAWKPAPV